MESEQKVTVAGLVQAWEAVQPFLKPGKPLFYSLGEREAAGYMLWLQGGCPEQSLMIVDGALETCRADRYIFWHNVRCWLEEAAHG